MAKSYVMNTEKTWHQTEQELASCFRSWGVHRWTVEPNTTPGRVNARHVHRAENAVTVRYWKGDREIVLTLDTQDTPAKNLRALFLCLDAMRLIDLRGVGDVAKSAYAQLAAPKTARDPHEVLGLRPGATRDEVEAMYRVKAKSAHPDRGGSDEAMAELNAARERLLSEARA